MRTAPRPTLLDWEALTALGDRPFHPTGRARAGWDQPATAATPGRRAPVALDWVAVRRDHLDCRHRSTVWPRGWPGPGRPAGNCGAIAQGPGRASSPSTVGRRRRGMPCGRPTGRYWRRRWPARGSTGRLVVLPVHPWQHAHVLAELFAREWRTGVCVSVVRCGLGDSGRRRRPGRWRRWRRPPGWRGSAGSRQTPVGISTLGACGCCRPATWPTPPGPRALLETAAARHPALQGRLHACDERAWWVFALPGGPSYGDRPGHLGCLLRVWPDGIGFGDGARASCRSALWAWSSLGDDPRAPGHDCTAPGLARLVAQRGDDPASPDAALTVFDDVARVVSELALACFGLGFLPELHGQNAVLSLTGVPGGRMVLRDHDTVRLHRPWLADARAGRPRLRREARHAQQPWAASPEALLGWFQTLALKCRCRP